MNYIDETEEGEEVVRSFMVTGGRTRTAVEELAIETLVSASASARLNAGGLDPRQRRVLSAAIDSTSIAELSASLDLPLRAVVILVSEMVDAKTLDAQSTVDVIDTSFLSRIRSAFEAL